MYEVKIKEIRQLNHNVKQFIVEKPEDYEFKPGQACSVAISRSDLKDEKRPFTFTSLPDDEDLEFTIKIYPERDGVTDDLDEVREGGQLLIGDPWGAIQYQGEGVFIAGGAGVTPFISILKQLHAEENVDFNHLVFANKTKADVFLEAELESWVKGRYVSVLSQEKAEGYRHGRVDKELLHEFVLEEDVKFYLCGPPKIVEEVSEMLKSLNVSEENIITEDLN